MDKLVSLGVKANSEVGGSQSRSVQNSGNRETGVNASSTTTETEQISQQQGGRIRVESEPLGATFIVELPVVSAFPVGQPEIEAAIQEPVERLVATHQA